MASLIESVRQLHGPSLVAHESGYDVDVIREECTRLRVEALDQAAGEGVDLSYSAESVRVPYPCSTRVVAGTTAAEGKDEATRMRLEHLVVQREEIEEQIERLDAVIGLIRRDRKSTRLNSSHVAISYAVFCMKKKRIKVGEKSMQLIYER